MKNSIKSIRSFIGAKDHTISRAFYHDFGFEEILISEKLSYFKKEDFGFYLQDYYLKDWIENSMLFLEVLDVSAYHSDVKKRKLESNFEGVKISRIVKQDWGQEFFMHDPAGVLWHIGSFNH